MGNTLIKSKYVYAETYDNSGTVPTSSTEGFPLQDTTGVSVLCHGIGGNLAAAGSLKCYIYDDQFGLPATGFVALEKTVATGALVATINGIPISVTWATSDTATADAIAAAINADATLSQYVSAFHEATDLTVPDREVVRITALAGGTEGNAYTLVVSGTGYSRSAATLASGAAATWVPCPELDLTVATTGATSQLWSALEVPVPRTSRVVWVPSGVTTPTHIHVKIFGSLRYPFNKY